MRKWMVVLAMLYAPSAFAQTPRQQVADFLTKQGMAAADMQLQQDKALKESQTTIDMIKALGDTACADAMTKALTTPNYMWNALVDDVSSSVNAKAFERAFTVWRAMNEYDGKRGGIDDKAREDFVNEQLLKVYGDAEHTDATRLMADFERDGKSLTLTIEMSVMRVAQLRTRVCGAAQEFSPSRLAVACTPGIQVLDVAPPAEGSATWRVRVNANGIQQTWSVNPGDRARSSGGDDCRFTWSR